MSRVLITLWPFTGHLLPQMSVAIALRERGHEVAFYSGEAVRATVEREGFALFGFERVDEQRVFELVHAIDTGDRRRRPGGGRLLSTLREWLVETIPAQVGDLRSVLARWRPDVIATDLSMWAPIVVLWESERIPVALSSTFMGPLIPGPDAPAFGFGLAPPRTPWGRQAAKALTAITELAATPLRRRVDAIRTGYALAPLGESVNRYTARLPLCLVGNVRELDYGRRDLPPTVHYLGDYIWFPSGSGSGSGSDSDSDPDSDPDSDSDTDTDSNSDGDGDGARWLERIPSNRPWVHVTESSLASGDPFLLRTAIEALAGSPVELIVTTGGQRDPQALGLRAPAPNVHITRWLRHDELLPRCAAVVTVGGKSTILAAMTAGVPVVVVPTSWDKPDNARRVTEAGAGLRLAPRRCTPTTLRDAVRQVLYQPRYRAGAQRLAALLQAAPGPARAAELLEGLAQSDGVATASATVNGGMR